jgi:molybdenum cofactor cytidylyltransferase
MIKVSAVLLGAGESKRMGVDKLSLPWKDKTVLFQCLDSLLRSKAGEVVVVLSNRTRGIGRDFPLERVKVVVNPHSKRGMSTSIRRGLQAIDPQSKGVLIALGDQPLLQPQTINALIRAFLRDGKKAIVLPLYRGEKGHPVLFSRFYEKELLKLKGDVGGRSIVDKYGDHVIEVRTKSGAVIRDMDTWKEYQKGFRIGGRISIRKGKGRTDHK